MIWLIWCIALKDEKVSLNEDEMLGDRLIKSALHLLSFAER
jgi:hypothetical protein